MGAVEKAVDAAAEFIGPFLDTSTTSKIEPTEKSPPNELVQRALSHLQDINTTDLAADPDAPYDASLAGVVYGLLDLIVSLGILPHLSAGVAFSQRPRSVLTTVLPIQQKNDEQLSSVVEALMPILNQNNTGVQPLLNQRNLPDLVSALVELSFSPTNLKPHEIYRPIYQKLIEETSTSRLLPILTTFLQQPLPIWLKPVISRELGQIPLRQRGIRHVLEFIALAFISTNSEVPCNTSGAQSQIPIPLEAVTQVSQLLVRPPHGVQQNDWLRKIAPQLWTLLDGTEEPELSRAAGQIIAGGILSKRATGAPGSVGWELFAQPILETLSPKVSLDTLVEQSVSGGVLVQEQDLEVALRRLSTIALSYSHAGILRRLIGPILLPLWALLNYAQSRPALNKSWSVLPKDILSRYMAIACDPKQVDGIAQNMFWDGPETWNHAPGSGGGIEMRRSAADHRQMDDIGNILTRIGNLDARINLLVSLLAEAKTPDDIVGAIFLQTTRRWLSPAKDTRPSLTDEVETNPLTTLTGAKLTEAMANAFKDQFARSPQHIMELMRQLLSSYVSEHQRKVEVLVKMNKSIRANLRGIVKTKDDVESAETDTSDEDLVSFAISILSTLVSSPDFQQTPETRTTLASTIAPLVYLSQPQPQLPIKPLLTNSATALLQLLQPPTAPPPTHTTDPLAPHRATLKSILTDITSPEPPNRTWALNTLRKLIKDSTAFPVIDVPSTTHLLLSASLADPESYVHIAAIPVLVDLAIRAPNPTIKILVDAFIDIDEQSLKLSRSHHTDEKETQLQHALDFRLRVGEVLNNILLADTFWSSLPHHTSTSLLKLLSSSCLALSSRRAQRTQTHSTRTSLAHATHRRIEEGEAAWGGPIPNVFDPRGEHTRDEEREEMERIVKGWEDTGVEEDVRIRASALSLLGSILEHRLAFVSQASVDAAMQIVVLILTMETGVSQAISRRAAVLVIMGLLRGLDSALERGEEITVGLSMKQQGEVERVVGWVGREDGDDLVRDHAGSVVEGMGTLGLKRMYRAGEGGVRLGVDLGLEGGLRGLNVRPDGTGEGRKLVVEEIE